VAGTVAGAVAVAVAGAGERDRRELKGRFLWVAVSKT